VKLLKDFGYLIADDMFWGSDQNNTY